MEDMMYENIKWLSTQYDNHGCMHHLLADGPYCNLSGKGRLIVGAHADVEQFMFIYRVEGQC